MRNACHRAQLHALRLVKMSHAFGAFLRVDDIDMLAQRNSAIGALRLTDIAIDAFFCNHQGHGLFSSSNTKTAYYPRLITALRPLYPSYPVTRMGLFLFKRLAALLLTLLLASAVVFAVLEVLPGNAAQVMLGPDAAPEAVRALERQLGLNQPALLRYGHWLSGLLQGQMGTSHAYGSPVSHLITQRLALTLPLALLAMLLAGCLALAAGVFAAAQHRRVGDRLVMTVSQLGMAVPGFWLALLLVLVFAVHLRWFSAGGFDGWGNSPQAWLRALKSLLLPALALAVVQAAVLARMTRSAMLEVLQEDFIRTARARGLSQRAVLLRHALPNALMPILTLSGLQFASLLTGAIVVENVFFLPGLGRLLFQSVANRDLIVVRNGVLVLAALVIGMNAAIDVLQTWLDPRLQPASSGKNSSAQEGEA